MSLDKKRLGGRGLEGLLPSAQPKPSTAIAPTNLAAIEDIWANREQPRKRFDDAALDELAASIKAVGVLEPILVRKRPQGGFEIIAGERRWRAAQRAGLKELPIFVREMATGLAFEAAIIENLQREDLNELEKAQAFQTYLDQFGCSVEELAKKMGKDRSTVANSLRLLELPTFVKEALRSGKISAGHGRTLLPLAEESDQIAMCQRIQSESLSVRSTEAAVRLQIEEKQSVPFKKPSDKSPGKPEVPANHHLQQLQDMVRDLVGTKVEIKLTTKNAGKMIIHFNSNDEFEKIVAHLRKAG